jgi:hypothetical protein
MKSVAPLRRILFHFAIIGAMLMAASVAHAQAITLQPQGVFYRDQPIRPSGRLPHWISQSDCLAQDVIHFPVTMTTYMGLTLQVWAGNQGVDCQPAAERQGTAAECWLVYSAPATISPTTVDIKAVDIVARFIPGVNTQLGYPEACTMNPNSPPAGQQLTLYFMLISSGTSIAMGSGAVQKWTDIGYDIAPPTEATNLTANPGETRVTLNWTDAVDSDIVLYNFYCDPAPGSLPTADGGLTSQGPPLGLLDTGGVTGIGAGGISGIGTGGDLNAGIVGSGGTLGAGATTGFAGTDFGGTAGDNGLAGTAGTGGATATISGGTTTTTTTTQPNCDANSVLQPGVSPVLDASGMPLSMSLARYQCGSVNGIYAKTGKVNGLVNKVRYVFSVAAVDHVGNVGVFAANNACATPINVTDFFELYRAAGGKAGGGICSISSVSGGTRAGILLAGGVLALAFAARRSFRRRK